MYRPGITLLAGDAHPALAHQIARLAEATLIPATVSAFADGETRVRVDADIRDAVMPLILARTRFAREPHLA